MIDCSTISPQSARKVAEAARARGIEMLDAPVSGGTAGAEKGTLTFIVGGDAEVLERGAADSRKNGCATYFTRVHTARVRSRRSATTCCSRFT